MRYSRGFLSRLETGQGATSSARWGRALFRGSAAVLTPVLAVTLALAAPNARVAAAAESDPPVIVSALDEVAASEASVEQGSPVTVDKYTSETEQVVALPDRTFQLTVDAVPVRVQQDGAWVSINTDLSVTDAGFFTPDATTVPVEFGGGSQDVLARIQMPDGNWVSETWPLGPLPTPVVEGAVATYTNVLPEVDLRLTATADGMTEVFIIHSAKAAEDPRLKNLQIQISGATATTNADGSTTVVPDGAAPLPASEAPLRANKPQAWDSSEPESGPDGPGGKDNGEAVAVTATNDTLALNVDAVTDPGVTYPVYVDPDWTGGQIHAWYVDATYPNQVYLDGGAYTDGVQQMGYIAASYSSDGNSQLVRAFWQMDTSAVAGKSILAAAFNTTLVWGFNCTPSPMELWRVNGAPVGGTWNNTAGASWVQYLDGRNIAAGRSACPSTAVGFSVQAGVAAVAAGGGTSMTLGMKASDEGSSTGWKKWSIGAQLIVTYNTPPALPTILKFVSPSRGCGTDVAPALIGATSVTMSVNANDADGGNVASRFFVQKQITAGSWSNPVNALPVSLAPNGYLSTPAQAQGGQTVVTPAGTFAPGQYRWRASTYDGIASSGYAPYCYFSVLDTVPPGLPTVTVTGSNPAVGNPVTVNIHATASDQVAVFAVWWQYGTGTAASALMPVIDAVPTCQALQGGVRYVCADANGDSGPVTVTPIDTTATLWVASYDGAGQLSQAGTLTAKGTSFAASADPGVTLGVGHLWPTVSQTAPLGATIPDSHEGTGTAEDIALGLGTSGNSLSEVFSGEPQPVMTLGGLIPLANVIDSGGIIVQSGKITMPLSASLGWILPPLLAGESQMPNTVPLYICSISTGGLSNQLGSCTGRKGTLIGYVYTAAAAAPANSSPQRLCLSAAHIATLNAACTGTSVGFSLTQPPTSSPPLVATVHTERAFTVSAWLRPEVTDAGTAISQSGSSGSAYRLGVGVSGNYLFCVGRPEVSDTADVCAVGPVATPGQWQFVAGVWDPINAQLRLYVGQSSSAAVTVGRAPIPGEISASKGLSIGGAMWGGTFSASWRGQVAHPSIFPGIASATQLGGLWYQGGPN